MTEEALFPRATSDSFCCSLISLEICTSSPLLLPLLGQSFPDMGKIHLATEPDLLPRGGGGGHNELSKKPTERVH